MRKISCRGIRNNLSAYLDGELSPAENLEIEKHFPICPSCKEFFSQLKSAKEALNSLAKDIPTQEPAIDILAEVTAQLPRYELGIFTDPLICRIAAGMAMVLVLFVGWLQFKPISPAIFPSQTLVAQIQGEAQIYQNNQWQKLENYANIRPNEMLRTKDDSHLRIHLPDKSSLLLKEEALLEIKSLGPELGFSLIKGEILVSVVKGNPLFIQTPQAKIWVGGTAFKVLADEKRTLVEVLAGEVKIKAEAKAKITLKESEKIVINAQTQTFLVSRLSPEELKALEKEFAQANLYSEKKSGRGKRTIILWREIK